MNHPFLRCAPFVSHVFEPSVVGVSNRSSNPAMNSSPHSLPTKAAATHQLNIATHIIMATGLKRNSTTGVGRISAMTMFCAHLLRHCSNRDSRVSSLRAISSRLGLSWVLYQPGESRSERRGVERPEEDGLRGWRRQSVVIVAFCRSGKRNMVAAVRPLRMREVVFISSVL